jgi:hypothetical protein
VQHAEGGAHFRRNKSNYRPSGERYGPRSARLVGTKNNIDTVIEQCRSDQYITILYQKQKDAAPFDQINLSFEIVDDAPVIVAARGVPIARKRRLAKNNSIAFQALCNVRVDSDLSLGASSYKEQTWHDECARVGLGGTDNVDSQTKAFRRAYNALRGGLIREVFEHAFHRVGGGLTQPAYRGIAHGLR